MRTGSTLRAATFLLGLIAGPIAARAAECEAEKDRFLADYANTIQRGAEAVDDDHAYCETLKQGLAVARAYYDWGVKSGCLAGDAAQRAASLAKLKSLVDTSQTSVDSGGCK